MKSRKSLLALLVAGAALGGCAAYPYDDNYAYNNGYYRDYYGNPYYGPAYAAGPTVGFGVGVTYYDHDGHAGHYDREGRWHRH